VLAGLAVLLFPDGRIPSGRWKPVPWAYLAIGAVWLTAAFAISLGAVLGHHVSIDASGGLTSLDDPAGSTAWFDVVQAVFFAAVAVCWLAWLVGKIVTYRRSAGERRLQLKWLISGAAVFIAAGITLVTLNNPVGWLGVVEFLAALGTLALPVSIGFGIPEVPAVRHRPDHQPHRGLRDRHRAPGRAVRGAGAAGHGGAPVPRPGRWRPSRAASRITSS